MSDKPIPERLQVKGERRLAVIGASAELDGLIGAADARAGVAEAEVVLVFTNGRAELSARLAELRRATRPDSILWAAYPKLTSPLAGDLSRETVREVAAALALDTVSQIAIDADWSAMRLKRV
jgi:hypothetical protein